MLCLFKTLFIIVAFFDMSTLIFEFLDTFFTKSCFCCVNWVLLGHAIYKNMGVYMETGKIIKEYRTNLKMTQEELAHMLGLQKSAIAKYENGRVNNIKTSILKKMSEIFGCSPSVLLGIEDPIDSFEKPTKIALTNEKYADEVAELMNIYMNIDDEDKEYLMITARRLYRK